MWSFDLFVVENNIYIVTCILFENKFISLFNYVIIENFNGNGNSVMMFMQESSPTVFRR
jgi:hypothetical protein